MPSWPVSPTAPSGKIFGATSKRRASKAACAPTLQRGMRRSNQSRSARAHSRATKSDARCLRVFSDQGLPPLLEKLAETMDNMTFATIPGADHAYSHQRDSVWGVVRRWLEKV